MGKIRTKKGEKKKLLKVAENRHNELQLKNTVGKLESDISAISLGPPRSKILKKSASSPGSSLLSSNFASRVNLLNKQKKKVRFCQNLVAEELKEQKASTSENAKHYFKVIHPSAIEKKKAGAKFLGDVKVRPSAIIEALIPDSKVLMAQTSRSLRKLIKGSTKNKKTIMKARRESFKKKMELLKTKQDDQAKAKQRQQTVIVGDMHQLLQALPALTSNDDDELETDLMAKRALEEDKKKTMPSKNKFSVKQQQKAMLDSLRFFEASGVTTGLSKT